MSTFLSQEEIKTAIGHLSDAAEICETNEPINRARGDNDQADLERHSARSYRGVIQILKARLV